MAAHWVARHRVALDATYRAKFTAANAFDIDLSAPCAIILLTAAHTE